MKRRIAGAAVLLCLGLVLICGCCKGKADGKQHQEVVVYTSMDMVYRQPVFNAFEKETGIKVLAVYDSEATKTIGLVNRLIAEEDNPRADVFWNAETGKTITLKKKGVLAKYVSPSASDIPGEFKDPEGYWAGFAARCSAKNGYE